MKLADASLHLALLDEIQPAYAWVGEMQDAYEVARAEHPEWPSWAAMHDDEDAPKPSLEAFLLTLDVPDEALTGVTRLTLDNPKIGTTRNSSRVAGSAETSRATDRTP